MAQPTPTAPTYPNQVGDIAFDPATDKANFYLCNANRIYQHYNFGTTYTGEKKALLNHCFANFKTDRAFANESGYVVIRFVVNCRGETDRFRVQEIGFDYQPKKFPSALVNHLLTITKSLHGWIPGKAKDAGLIDSYAYLNFILKDGHLVDVAP